MKTFKNNNKQKKSKKTNNLKKKYQQLVSQMKEQTNLKKNTAKLRKQPKSYYYSTINEPSNYPIPQTQLYLTPKHIPIPLVDSNMVEALVNQQLPILKTLVANITYEQYVKFMEGSTKKCIPYHNLIRDAISLMKYIVTHFTNYEKSDAITKETKTLIQNLSTNYFSSNLSSILITNLFNNQIEQSVDDICKKIQTLNEAEFNLLKSFFIDYLFNLKEIGKNIEMNKFITLVNSYIESFNQYNQLLYSI